MTSNSRVDSSLLELLPATQSTLATQTASEAMPDARMSCVHSKLLGACRSRGSPRLYLIPSPPCIKQKKMQVLCWPNVLVSARKQEMYINQNMGYNQHRSTVQHLPSKFRKCSTVVRLAQEDDWPERISVVLSSLHAYYCLVFLKLFPGTPVLLLYEYYVFSFIRQPEISQVHGAAVADSHQALLAARRQPSGHHLCLAAP